MIVCVRAFGDFLPRICSGYDIDDNSSRASNAARFLMSLGR